MTNEDRLRFILNQALTEKAEHAQHDCDHALNDLDNALWQLRQTTNMTEEQYRALTQSLNQFRGDYLKTLTAIEPNHYEEN